MKDPSQPGQPAGGLELSVGVEDMFAATCQMPDRQSLTECAEVRTGADRTTEINLIEFALFLV